MIANEMLPLLYEALKLYCKVHDDRGFDQYNNGMLYKIAINRPRESSEIAELLPDEEFFRETGPELTEVVRLFTASATSDSLNSRARSKLEQIEILLYD